MTEPQFPVDLVSPDGAAWQANTNAELVQLVYGEGYLLRRAIPGVPVRVAQGRRADAGRDVSMRRGDAVPAAAPNTPAEPEAVDDGQPEPEPVENPGSEKPAQPEPKARPRARTRKER